MKIHGLLGSVTRNWTSRMDGKVLWLKLLPKCLGGREWHEGMRETLSRPKNTSSSPSFVLQKNTFRAPTFSDSTHGGSTISRDIDPPGCHLRILDGETYFFVTPMVRLKLFSKCLGRLKWHEGMREKLSRPKNTSSSPYFVLPKNKI